MNVVAYFAETWEKYQAVPEKIRSQIADKLRLLSAPEKQTFHMDLVPGSLRYIYTGARGRLSSI